MNPIETASRPDFVHMAETYRALALAEPHAQQAALFAAIAEDFGELAAEPVLAAAEMPAAAAAARAGLFARWLSLLHFWPDVPSSSEA
jgi:hypothetical protein